MSDYKYRAGDHVKHIPSDEEWILACDEENNEVTPLGYPLCFAKVKDIVLLKTASDQYRLQTLKNTSEVNFEDERKRIAKRQLSIDQNCKTLLNFGQALNALKQGKRIAREGWNGKRMFLFLLPAGTVPTKAIHDPALREVIEKEVGGETFEALGSIRMFTADKKILTGWLASQTDMLSEDWVIV